MKRFAWFKAGMLAIKEDAEPGMAWIRKSDYLAMTELYKDLHRKLAPAIDYVQHNQEKFNVTLGQDIIPVIVDAFLKSQK